MSALRTTRKLLFGETLLLPLGVATTIAGAVLLRDTWSQHWRELGGFLMLAAVIVLVLLSVSRSVPRRTARRSRARPR